MLVVSMAATVNRLHKKSPPIEKYLPLQATVLINQQAQSAAFFDEVVKWFWQKSGGF